jgi:type II secretory pathway component PulK
MKRNATAQPCRRASALLLTLIVVVLLTLGAMAFFERMFAEHEAVRAYGRQMQSRHMAESGVEYVKAVLMQDPATIRDSGGLYINPQLFKGILIADDPNAAFRGRFTAMAPDLTPDGYYGGVRWGLENESARLNLNTVLLADDANQENARKLLMTLPGMTESIADAILDWIDSDDDTRMMGAERDYYSSLNPTYLPRNGPLGSIEELLLVRDVTPALLFGADLNRNGVIDGNEEQLAAIENVDNSMGVLNRGWAAYLTLDSAESNLRPDGRPKIDVNMDSLEELHKQLLEVFSKDEADFIVAFRQGGSYTGEQKGQSVGSAQVDLKQQGRERLRTILDLIGARTQIAKPGAGGGNQSPQGPNQPNSPETPGGDGEGPPGGNGNGDGRGDGVGQGGGGGPGGGQSNLVIIEAAFPNDPGAMQSYLPKLMDNVAVNAAPTIPGRININQAPRQLLAGIPGLTSTAVDQILSNRDVTLGQQQPEQIHETWLLTSGVVDLDGMKGIIGLVTTGGNVYRAQIVGFFDAAGPADRLEVVIDATKTPPVVRRRWELRDLGPGYSLEVLGAALDDLR